MGIYRGTGTSGTGISSPDVLTRVALAGDTMTGYLNVPAGATGTQVPQRGEIDTALALKATITTLTATGGAALIGNTPTGNIAATTVQAALNELDTEKANLAGSASQAFSASIFTGALTGNATTTTDTVSKTGTGSTYVTNTSPTLITPSINSAQFATVSGTAPLYACRAWVNFDGTGTVSIRASGNVSSITDNGVGDYTVNFTTAMPDANYSHGCNSYRPGSFIFGTPPRSSKTNAPTTTTIKISTYIDDATGTTIAAEDTTDISCWIFR